MDTLYVGLDVGSSTCHLVAEDSQAVIVVGNALIRREGSP
jgi:hypothetical protein